VMIRKGHKGVMLYEIRKWMGNKFFRSCTKQ